MMRIFGCEIYPTVDYPGGKYTTTWYIRPPARFTGVPLKDVLHHPIKFRNWVIGKDLYFLNNKF